MRMFSSVLIRASAVNMPSKLNVVCAVNLYCMPASWSLSQCFTTRDADWQSRLNPSHQPHFIFLMKCGSLKVKFRIGIIVIFWSCKIWKLDPITSFFFQGLFVFLNRTLTVRKWGSWFQTVLWETQEKHPEVQLEVIAVSSLHSHNATK